VSEIAHQTESAFGKKLNSKMAFFDLYHSQNAQEKDRYHLKNSVPLKH
jgi:hypothetical protein